MTAMIRRICLVVIVAVLTGCASVDFDAPKSVTYVLTDTDDTYLGKQLEGEPEQQQARPQPDGVVPGPATGNC